MLAKDQARDELAERGFVPYGEVVRLRRMCRLLAWALGVVVVSVVFVATINVRRSFHDGLAGSMGRPPASQSGSSDRSGSSEKIVPAAATRTATIAQTPR